MNVNTPTTRSGNMKSLFAGPIGARSKGGPQESGNLLDILLEKHDWGQPVDLNSESKSAGSFTAM